MEVQHALTSGVGESLRVQRIRVCDARAQLPLLSFRFELAHPSFKSGADHGNPFTAYDELHLPKALLLGTCVVHEGWYCMQKDSTLQWSIPALHQHAGREKACERFA